MMSKIHNKLTPEKDRNLSPLQILVVDDNEDTLILTTFILEDYNAKVITARSASEALKIFSQTKPDIIICDIAMPNEDGYSLISKIRKLKPEQGGQIPAIALTASAREEDRRLSIAAGFQIHLTKPIEPTELIEVVIALAKNII